MTYEPAKELKEAGFPQREEPVVFSPVSAAIAGRERAYIPTLEELIEACGEEFSSLDQIYKNGKAQKETYWTANGVADSSSPTEAVARLWLALNKR